MEANFQARTAQLLVVEDEPAHVLAIRQAIAEIRSPEIDVHVAQDLNHALDLLDERDIDVCLSDYHLWAGANATDLLRSARHHGHRIAFVAITGRRDEESLAHELLVAGFDDVLHKDDLQTANLYRIVRNSWLRNIRSSEIEENATTDALTGIANRRALETRLQIECDRCERLNSQFSVLYLDLNGFKQINDRHGHATGDAALKHFSSMLIDSVRKTDVVGRLSGDEFLIILPNTTQAIGVAMGEKIRMLAKGTPLEIDQQRLPLSAAIGLAVYNATDGLDTPAALLGKADEAMYEDKQRVRH